MHIVLKTGINVTHLAARWGIIFCALCVPLSGLDDWLRGEQLASLRPFLAASACLALVWFGLNKQLRWAFFATICGLLHLQGTLPEPDSPPSHEPTGSCFRTLVVNAYGANPDQTRFAEISSRARADVVIISELGRPLDRALRKDYRHASTVDPDHVFGLGIYSVYPISDSKVSRRGAQDNPFLRVTLTTPTGPVQVIAVHPTPPGTPESMDDRNALIRELAELASNTEKPIIVAGDFNTTSWSRHLLPLHRVAKRAPTAGTWPVWSWIKIPIDHIFFSGLELKTTAAFSGDHGADHVPILAELCGKRSSLE